MIPISTLRSLLAVLALVLLPIAPAFAFETFLGTYVGGAELVDTASGQVEQRDVETVIEPFGDGGFRVTWRSVVRKDGRRDVPGVRLVVRSLTLEPVSGSPYFVNSPDYDPFSLRETLEPMAGDALAWATVEAGELHLFVFAIGEEGQAELQHHRRRLTPDGMALDYLGIVDGKVLTRGTGHMVKVD